jgi:hypothetical protein
MQIHGKNSILKKINAFILLFCMSGLLNAASVEAILSKNEVVQGNMVQLKIKATGSSVEFPNIRKIGGSDVLGRHKGQNNSFTYINGEMKNMRSSSLVLTFAPQHNMTIPSYEVTIDGKTYKTKPLELKVVKSTAPKVANNNKYSLQMRANKKSVMVGEPLLVTVYFSLENGVRLSENPQYNAPAFKDFFVKEIKDEKSYAEGNRQVTELRYLLIPKREGNFTIEPATAKVGVADTSRRDMFGRFFGTVWTPIVSNSIDIEVKELPQSSDLVGNFYIDSSIDKQQVKANKPVNLKVKIEGEGSLEDFEFPEYDIDGVTVYSDDAKVETRIIGKKLKSTYTKSFAFISDANFTIPKRSITVYNTKNNELKTLTIPSYEIKVEQNRAMATKHTTGANSNSAVVQTNIKTQKSMLLDDENETDKTKSVEPWMLALAFAFGLFVMYIINYLSLGKFKRVKSPYKESEALKILYAHTNESKEVEDMVRKLYARKNGDKSVEIDKKVLKELVERFTK